MTENMQADDGQNRKAVFVRCCLKSAFDLPLTCYTIIIT